MGQEAINRAARTAKRARVLGGDARCAQCGWTDLTALTKANGQVLCYECQSVRHGRATVEDHHMLRRANDPATVPVPGNLHRSLSDRQDDWPADLRTNPERDPLVWLAQACRGLGDHLAWWAKILLAVAMWFIDLAKALQREHGATWWVALGIPALGEVIRP